MTSTLDGLLSRFKLVLKRTTPLAVRRLLAAKHAELVWISYLYTGLAALDLGVALADADIQALKIVLDLSNRPTRWRCRSGRR